MLPASTSSSSIFHATTSKFPRRVFRGFASKMKVAKAVAPDKQPAVRVFGCGLSASGALAIPQLVLPPPGIVTPMQIEKARRITFCNGQSIRRVAAGFGHSLFASRTRIYGSGLNNRLQIAGQVSPTLMQRADDKRKRLEKKSKENTEDEVEEEPEEGELGDPKLALGEEYYVRARRVHLPVVDVVAGRAHSLILTTLGVFGIGDNCHGQCAIDPSTSELVYGTPSKELQPIRLPTDAKPVQVHCGLDTSYVLTEDGKLYAFGLNEDGQCGSGRYGIEIEPREVEGDAHGEKIKWIGGSTDTPLAISESGELFAWGQNEYGQLGDTQDIQVNYSRRIGFRFTKPVVSAGSTRSSCVAVTSDGCLHSWGAGFVGLGPDHWRLNRPATLDQPLFGGEKVVYVEAGNTTVFAVTEKRVALAWGQNRFGILGVDRKDPHIYFPLQVPLPATVKRISSGADHTLFICD